MARFVDFRLNLRLASLSSLSTAFLLAALAGCGDDTPGQPHDSGSGGSGGGSMQDAGNDAGGAGGSDAGADTGTDTGADTTGEVPKPCYMVTFTAPTDGAMLTAADDKDGDNCANGFQVDVQITTDAPDGADVSLFGGSALLKAGSVLAGAVTFSGVQIATTGDTQLSIQFPGREACTAATTKARVNVDCHVPACSVTKPTISGAHPKLNGVPAPAGDRVSADGSAYQAAFEVTTDVEDGQTVSLLVDDAAAPTTVTTVTAMASGGKATFPGVTLTPDATYEIQASCPARNGVIGRSMKGTYIVDTAGPSLTVSKPTNGEFFGPTDLTGGNFQVCASTTSADAANLSPGLGAAAQNLCAFIGSSPLCAAVAATGASTCINIPCNGGAPFDITVVLNDDAGNKTSSTVNAVACASSLPSVQIITPVSDAPTFTDPSKHLLAASGGVTDVVACTNRSGTAVLSVGHMGDPTLSQVGTAVPTTPTTGGCPAGFGFQATFAAVGLPQSFEDANGVLTGPTELRVDVTDVSTATGSSLPVDVWVDSGAPMLSLLSPAGLCGSFHQVAGLSGFNTQVQLSSDLATVALTVTNGGSTDTLAPTTYAGGVATFSTVAFDQGQNTLAAAVTDPAGNTTTLAPVPCTVTVGMAPVVTFTSPTAGKELCAGGSIGANCINDTTPATTGWQGLLLVHVTGGGSPIVGSVVTFSVTPTGSAVTTTLGMATTDAGGNATLANATVLDGTMILTATTDDVPGRGVGTGTVTVLVDTGPPDAPTNLVANDLDRRQTSFHLTWDAPGDNGGTVSSYEVRVARVLITAANFDDTTVTTAVTWTGMPKGPGVADGITAKNLYIENGYFFAVRAIDAAGNKGTIAATSAAVTAHFNVTLIAAPSGSPVTNPGFGAMIDGSADVNGDGVTDLLVGTNGDKRAYIFFGGSTFAPTTPSVLITGTNAIFGAVIRAIGDIDQDGLQDVAVCDPGANRVLIFKGRTTWPATLSDQPGSADYVISTDSTWVGSNFGTAMARLGDFDGDGTDDFVIGAPAFNTRVGRAVVIYGRNAFGAGVALPDTTRSLEIGADATLNRPQFGLGVVGLGHFYAVTAGTTLIVSGPGLGNASSTSSNEGRIYAFHGRGPGAPINATDSDHVLVGPAKGALIGGKVVNLGPIANSLPSVGSENVSDTLTVPGQSGTGYVLSGTATTGPLANRIVLIQSGATGGGQVMFGGGFSGRDTAVSLISDSRPDLAMSSQIGASTVDIFDGNHVPALTGTVDTRTKADVHVPLPSGWLASASAVSALVNDINNDGYPDFALGDVFGSVPGRVAVFW